MKPPFGDRLEAWVLGAFVSVGVAVVVALLILLIASMTAARDQALLGAGVGIFTVVVLWPGILSMCLIFFDGRATEGFSKALLGRSVAWGAIPPILFYTLIKLGANKIGAVGATGGGAFGTLLVLVLFLTVPFVVAYLAIRLRAGQRRIS